MVSLLFTLIIWGLVFAVVWWGINQIPLPPPFAMVVRVIFVLAVVIVLLNILGVFGAPHVGVRIS